MIVPRKDRAMMKVEAILQDYDDSNDYPNEYECVKKSKRRKKRENVKSPKSEKWIKTGSGSDIPLGRYRGISGSTAMDEEAIEYDLRQDEHYFFDENDMFSNEEECQSLQYRGVLESVGNSPMKLYVDGLNYLDRFFTINRSKRATVMIDFENDLKKAQSKVKNFVKSAENSNINLEVFIDKSVATEETFLKWKSRREQEFEDGRDSVPPCPSLLLGELFTANGIPVHYSTVDCDDSIASFAYHYGGNVLSNDSDFFRYTSRNKKSSVSSLSSREQRHFQIFSNFQLQGGVLHLTPARVRPNKIIASERIFLSPPPETRKTGLFLDRPMQWEVDEHPEVYGSLPSMYTRGNVSHLLRHFTNPHLTVRPLRQALYNRLGEKSVRERICTWNFDEGKVEWVEENVFPDGTFGYLLDNPQAAVKFFFGLEIRPKNVSDLSWKNHLFAQEVVVASICAWATGKSILYQLNKCKKFDKPFPVQEFEKMSYASITRGHQELEDMPKTTKFHQRHLPRLEGFRQTTKSRQELEKMPKTTKVRQKMENMLASTKGNQELEKMPKTTTVLQRMENMPKTTKGYQKFENLTKSTKGHQELKMPEVIGKIPSKLKELDIIKAPNKLDVPQRYLYCVVCKMVCRCRHAKNQDHQEFEKSLKTTCKKELYRISSVLQTYCSVCDMQFINALMYQSHIGGRRHAKKAAVQINNNFPQIKDAPSCDLYCVICDVQCNSAAMYKSHVRGKPHAAKATAQTRNNFPEDKNSPSCDLYCSLCDVKCNSAAMYKSHVGGKPHAAKAATQTSNDFPKVKDAPTCYLYCSVCDLQCNSDAMYQSHVGGKSHAAKAATQTRNDFPKVKDAPSCYRYCSVCDLQCNSAAMYKSHVGGKSHAAKATAQTRNDFPKVKDAPSGDLYCSVCDVKCNSAAMYKSHVGGRQHEKKAHIKSITIACEMCNIFVNSEDVLKAHKLGKKHKVKAKQLDQN